MLPEAVAALRAAALTLLLVPSVALATAGYFQLGYGLKAKGLGGAAAAFPQDALAGATNPAGLVWVGNRLDAGLELFEADRGTRITGNTLGLSGDRDANGRKAFPVPEFGFNRMLGPDLSLGVAVFGNGGMTRYADNALRSLGGSNPAGFEYAQVTLAPSLAMKVGEGHSVGVSLHFVYQEFVARGIEHFDDPAFSASPGRVTNRGRDHALGIGWRAGWLGKVTPALTLGASYQPRTRMEKFRSYKGLLADEGNFDVPETYVVGAAWALTPALTLAGDLQRINFAGVPSLGNSSECFLAVSCLLGSPGGPGSGWRNTDVYKVGLSWQLSPQLTLRGGVSLLRKPMTSGQTLLNMFAPAVSEKHLSFGATWQLAPQSELTFSYMHAFKGQLQGNHSIPPGNPPGGVGGGEADLRMRQRALGVSWGWRM